MHLCGRDAPSSAGTPFHQISAQNGAGYGLDLGMRGPATRTPGDHAARAGGAAPPTCAVNQGALSRGHDLSSQV